MEKKESAKRLEQARRIRKIREYYKLTQEQFSEKVGISYNAYKMIELGKNSLTLETVTKIKNAVNVTADFLLYGEMESFEETWRKVECCSDADKMQILIRLLDYFCYEKEPKLLQDKHQIQNILELLVIDRAGGK